MIAMTDMIPPAQTNAETGTRALSPLHHHDEEVSARPSTSTVGKLSEKGQQILEHLLLSNSRKQIEIAAQVGSLENLQSTALVHPSLVDSWLEAKNLSISERASMIFALLAFKEAPMERSSSFKLLYYVPMVNIFVEVFIDKTPDLDSIRTILELLGIMGALLFSLIVSTITQVDYTRYYDAIERWETGGPYADCWISGQGEVEWFVVHAGDSMKFSFMSFIIIIITYILLAGTNFSSDEEVQAWWTWMKGAVLLCIFLLGAGIVDLFLALQNMIEWSVPNESFVAQHGCSINMLASTDNIWGKNNVSTSVIIGISSLIAFIFFTGGVVSKHRSEEERRGSKEQKIREELAKNNEENVEEDENGKRRISLVSSTHVGK